MLDAYVFAIMSPRNNKLAPSLNFFGVGLYCCDVLQSRRNSLKGQNQGKDKVKLKGDPTLHLMTLVAKVNEPDNVLPPPGKISLRITCNKAKFALKKAIRLERQEREAPVRHLQNKFLILRGVDCN